MLWYFISFVLIIFVITGGIVIYNSVDFSWLDVINRLEKLIWILPEIWNKGLIENNKLILDWNESQVFYIKWKDNIIVKTNNENPNNIMISFINTKTVGEDQVIYKKNVDYKIIRCKTKDCRFEKNNDFIILEFDNNTNRKRKINELLLEAINMQKIRLSLLKKDTSNNIVYNVSFDYIVKTGDNNIKFPTVILDPGEKLYIKVKIIDDNYSI